MADPGKRVFKVCVEGRGELWVGGPSFLWTWDVATVTATGIMGTVAPAAAICGSDPGQALRQVLLTVSTLRVPTAQASSDREGQSCRHPGPQGDGRGGLPLRGGLWPGQCGALTRPLPSPGLIVKGAMSSSEAGDALSLLCSVPGRQHRSVYVGSKAQEGAEGATSSFLVCITPRGPGTHAHTHTHAHTYVHICPSSAHIDTCINMDTHNTGRHRCT